MDKWIPWGYDKSRPESSQTVLAVRCGDYSIAKFSIAGKWRYLLFKLPATMLGKYESAEAAKIAVAKMNAEAEKVNVQVRKGAGNGELF